MNNDEQNANIMRKTLIYAALLSVFLTSSMLGMYYWFMHVHHKSDTIATINLSEVIKIQELKFSAMLARPGVTDKDRQDAYDMVSKLGPNIETAINTLQGRCGCTILVKPAVLAGASTDMTEDLKKLLGLEGLSSATMMPSIPQQPGQ
jgi:hypothetical protein